MFYCDDCAFKHGWPIQPRFLKWGGNSCEVCDQPSDNGFNDVPCSCLPPSKLKSESACTWPGDEDLLREMEKP